MKYTSGFDVINKKIISHFTYIDGDSGEIIKEVTKDIKIPSIFRFPNDFCKIHGHAKINMTRSDLGKFVQLTDCLEYGTNRLVDRHVGKTPIALKQQDMADRLNISERTVNSFIKRMKQLKAILRIDCQYYISPKFASRSNGLHSDIVIKMIEIDPSIKREIDEKQRRILNLY